MLTKQGADYTNPLIRMHKDPASMLNKARKVGMGPMGAAFIGMDVATGNASAGGALGGAALGQAVGYGTSKLLAKPIATASTALAKKMALPSLGSMVKNPTALKYLRKLPGPLKLLGLGASMYTGLKGYEAGKSFGDKFVPIWKKKSPSPLPGGLTPEQLKRIRRLAMAMDNPVGGFDAAFDTAVDTVNG